MSNIKFGLQLELKGDQVVIRGLDGARTAVSQLEREVTGNTRASQQATRANQQLAQSFGSLQGVITTLGIGYLFREYVQLTDQYNVLDQRVKTATRSTGDYLSVAKEVYAITQDNGIALAITAGQFQSFSRSKEALGATNAEMLVLTDTVQKLGVIGGSTREELTNGLRQFSQALNSPRVQAEEMNSILDQLPEVAKRIEQGLGLLPGSLKAAVNAGNVLSKDIFRTLLEQAPEIAREFNDIPTSVDRAWASLQNSIARTLGLIDDNTDTMTALAHSIQEAASALDSLNADDLEYLGNTAIMVAAAIVARFAGPVVQAMTTASAAQLAYTASVLQGNVVTLESAAAEKARAAASLQKTQVQRAATAAELAGYNATLQSTRAELALEAQRLKAQISDTGRQLSVQRMATLRMELAAATTALTRVEAAHSTSLAAEAAAMSRYTAAANAATVSNRALAVSGRAVSGAVAMLGGPAGVAILAAAGLYAFRDELSLIPDPARDAEVAIRKVTDAIEGTDKAATQARIHALTAQLADFKAEAAASAKAWDTFDPATAMLDGMNMAQAGASAFATVTQSASVAANKVKATEEELERLHKQLADFDKPDTPESDPSEESAKAAAKALMEKTALLAQENQLLALGYSLEEARFIAAYANADELTQAYLRQQREQKAVVDLYAEEAAMLQAISDGNDQSMQAQIDQRKALADAVSQFLNTDFDSNAFEAFDTLGRSLYGVADALDELADRQDAFNKLKAEEGLTTEEVDKINAKQAQSQLSAYADITGAAKGYFDEGSKGYKALLAAEQTLRAFEIAMAGKTLAAKLFATQTATAASLASVAPTVAAEGTKAAAAGSAAAASSMVGVPFPANLAALAATLAALAGIGVLIGGGSSGSSTSAPQSNADGSQGITGRNTVLGDVTAQSESIADSLGVLENLADAQLSYTAQMTLSLRNIEASITGFAGVLAQFPAWSNGVPLSVDSPSIGDVLAGSERERLEQLLEQPGTDSAKEALSAALPLADLYAEAIGDIIDTAFAGFETLGRDAADFGELINSLVLPVFDIDASLTAEQQNEAISAYFSSVGDSIVAILDPTILAFQQGGEGALETLTRVASQLIVLSDAGDALNLSLPEGDSLLSVADQLRALAGGVSDFSSNINAFLAVTLSDDAQFIRLQSSLNTLFAGFELSVPATRDELAELVRGLDLTTESGQRAFTAITGASDLLDDLFDQLETIADDAYAFDTWLGLEDGMDGLRNALADVGLNIDIVQTAAAQGAEGLQAVFAALSDAQRASLEPFIDALDDLLIGVDDLANAAATLREFARSATGTLQDANQQQATTQADYQAVLAAVAGGDLTRVDELTSLGTTLIDLAATTASNELEYQRVVAGVASAAASVADILDPQTELDIATEQLSVLQDIRAELAGYDKLPGADVGDTSLDEPSAQDTAMLANLRELSEQLSTLAAEQRSGHAAIATSTNKVAKLLERWDDGDALAVRETS